ncbi:MAG: HAD family hydrolase [Oscillospiraceae bacterium]|nr:HAD family hydrolase [Oscillospiraceae bacterium]
MRNKLAIFDLDGTVLDTLDDLHDSVNFALAQHGFALRPREEVRAFVGCGMRNLIVRCVSEGTPQEQTDAVLACFRQRYAAHCMDRTRPYDGVLDMLRTLRGRGVYTAVVSNKADATVQTLCRHYFPDLFDYVSGERDGVRRKPAPDAVNAVLCALGIAREEAIYIGDSEVDVATAENAALRCIAVDWGFRSRSTLLSAGAARVVSDVPTLSDAILE